MRKVIFASLFALLLLALLLPVQPHVVAHAQTDRWISKADTPEAGGFGEAVVGTGNYIYVARCLYASSTPYFWRYDPATNTWDSMSVSGLPTGAFRSGTALAWDHGDYIYALLGARYEDDDRCLFYRYDIPSNSWQQLPNTHYEQGAGDAIAWSGYDGYIYAILGGNQHGTAFARYDIAEDSWETLSLNPSWTVTDDGASLVWVGGEYLYALRGEWEETTPHGDFARYHIPTGTWQDMSPLPDPGGVADGASVLWVGSWMVEYSDYIFALGGGGVDESPGYNFYRYSISDDSWQQLESIPCPVGYYVGNRLGFANGHIYYWQGSPKTAPWICGGKAFYMFGSPIPTASDVECWAVIIGVADYKYISDLRYTDDDAQDLYDKLSPIWGEDHFRLLIDDDAAKADIEGAITGWLDDREDEDDIVLLFFAGHGGQYGGHEYLCPYDTLTYTSVITDDELASWLNELESENVAVILDSCHSGGFIDELEQDGRVILTACKKDEVAWGSPWLRHGVFSYYILEGLDNFLEDVYDNSDYEISAEELFDYARPKVEAYPTDEPQHPQISDRYEPELPLLIRATFDTSPQIASLTIDGTIYSPAELPVSLIWAPGSVHSCEVPSFVPGKEGIRYIFTSWSDGETSPSRTVSQGGAYTANYSTQYYLTVVSDYGDPQGEGWYDAGSTAIFSVTSPVEEGLIRHFFTSWSGDSIATTPDATITMDGPKTVIANWRTQYYLTVISDYGDPQGEGWHDADSTAIFSVTSPVGTAAMQYVFTNWSGDSTANTPEATILMDGPKTVTANWQTQYYLTVVSDYGDPQGEGWYDSGSTAIFSVTSPVEEGLIRHLFTNWSGNSTATTSTADILMDGPKTVVANWQTQYYLTVVSDYGDPQGKGWYDAGSTAIFSVTSPVEEELIRHFFTNWSGNSTATTSTADILMDGPKTVTANWHTQYYLTVVSDYGDPQGEGWYDSGSTAAFSVTSPVEEELIRHLFTNWSGDSTATTPTADILMDEPKTVTANWQTEYYLTVISDYGDPQGEGWYDSGSIATFSVTSPVGTIVRHFFTDWSGDSTATTPSANILMDGPKTVTANWRTDYTYLYALIGGTAGSAGVALAIGIILRRRA